MIHGKPSITHREIAYVVEAMKNGDVGIGSYVSKFESEWAIYNNKYAGVACNSGTTALYLALLALGIGPGDEVIVPEYTMIATAWAVTYTGAKPVFVDCGNDLNTDVSLIKGAITTHTKAIIPVHIYGRKCNMEAIHCLAKDYKLFVVEDMAEAHGIMPTGDIACYSFHGSKILTTGGGGMCLTDNKVWADEMRKLSHLYLNKDMTMIHEKIGHNFRLSNVQAAIGYSQVRRIDEILQKRRIIQNWYNMHLPEEFIRPWREVLWVYDIDCGDKQEEIIKKLKDAGIEHRYGFKPMSMQPMYNEPYQHLNAYRWSKRIIYLPTWTDMTEEDVINICNALR